MPPRVTRGNGIDRRRELQEAASISNVSWAWYAAVMFPDYKYYLIVFCSNARHIWLVIQVLHVRLFCCPFVRAKVILAGRQQILMSQNLFDMSYGTSVEKQRCGNRMAQHMRRNALLDSRLVPESPEPCGRNFATQGSSPG
jgi:hypothetical protein